MNNEAIKTISTFYGYDAPSRQMIEEMAELTQAINKYWRKNKVYGGMVWLPFGKSGEKEVANIKEEIADVTIMLEQIKYLLSISDTDINEIIEQKLNRQLERIGADERKS